MLKLKNYTSSYQQWLALIIGIKQFALSLLREANKKHCYNHLFFILSIIATIIGEKLIDLTLSSKLFFLKKLTKKQKYYTNNTNTYNIKWVSGPKFIYLLIFKIVTMRIGILFCCFFYIRLRMSRVLFIFFTKI